LVGGNKDQLAVVATVIISIFIGKEPESVIAKA
jgi:hypothetical protein